MILNFFGCIMYADDLLLLSGSVSGLQNLLDICSDYGRVCQIIFNAKKLCLVVGRMRLFNRCTLLISGHNIPWVDKFKYLGVTFACGDTLHADGANAKHKFYVSCNTI